MGVHGLTSYVEGNRGLFQDVRFRDSRLVIDGCSLFFRLYLNHGLDQAHGGDYDAFAALLSSFISALEACNIQPYVVLDGGMDPSDKKLSTLRQRLRSKIQEAESLSRGRHGSVLPLLTRHVFIQVLSQRGVPLVQCPAEADWEIACLANQWGCPVLTNDSDFYIFDLPGGYIPFRFFQWASVSGSPPNHYIPAKRYTVSGMCQHFRGMNRELLPLCAVLAGNDYTTEQTYKHIHTLLPQLTTGGKREGRGGGRGGGRPSHIEGLLLWLSSFPGPEEALEEVGRLTGGLERGGGRGRAGEKSGLCSVLWSGMQEYHLTPQSRLSTWFSGGSSRSPEGLWAATPCPLPEWLCWAAGSGAMAPLVLDVLELRRVLLIPQVENSRLPSSHCSATAIRQALYGILRLALGVTGFWRREARPFPSLPQVQALLLGMVHGEMARNTPPGQNQNTAAERNLWMKLRLRPGDRRGFDVGVAHSLSQWQACLWSVLSLNQLLCLPLPEPETAWLFSGSLVHGLVGRLRGGCSPESVLAAAPLSGHIYRSLLAALDNCTLNTLPSSSSGRRKRGRGGGEKGGRRGGAPTSQEINNRFSLLMTEEEDEE